MFSPSSAASSSQPLNSSTMNLAYCRIILFFMSINYKLYQQKILPNPKKQLDICSLQSQPFLIFYCSSADSFIFPQIQLLTMILVFLIKIIINMEKVPRSLLYQKQNDFQKGNKNKGCDALLMHKWQKNEKMYQSLSASIQLKPTFLKKKVLSNTSQFCGLYAEQILKGEANKEPCKWFLAVHEIDSNLRAKMIDWMIEVTTSYRFTNKTYFDSIQLMDRYFQAQIESLSPSKLHIIGVQCMLIASKMNEVYPLKIKTVYEKIGHRKLPIEDLVALEENIMRKLEYKLNSWTFFDLAMLKLSEYFAYEQQRHDSMGKMSVGQSMPEERTKQMEELCSFISKHLVFDYEFICENSIKIIAESCVKAVLEMFNVTSTPLNFFSCSSISLEIGKQKIYKIMKMFKSRYANLGNIFKFTPDYVLSKVAQFSLN